MLMISIPMIAALQRDSPEQNTAIQKTVCNAIVIASHCSLVSIEKIDRNGK